MISTVENASAIPACRGELQFSEACFGNLDIETLKIPAVRLIGISGRDSGPMDKLVNVVDMIKALMDKKFTGFIKINFTGGTIGKVEKFEEILKK